MSRDDSDLGRRRDQDDRGFTLIELLVVVVIIGVLIAIAIPLYLNYKRGAADKSAQSDLRNAVAVLEQCNAEFRVYPTDVAATGGTPGGCLSQIVKASTGTTYLYYPKSDSSAFIMSATNSGGTPKTFCFSSSTGGQVTTTATAVGAWRVAC